MSKPCALMVLGMHRSGTSALTRVLSLLGAELPSDLMDPVADDNETGFWESKELGRIHDEMLVALGSAWDDISPIASSAMLAPPMAGFTARVVDKLRADFSEARLFVLKDPRICRLVPAWQLCLEEFGAEPKFVLPLRNPLEVAASLKARNGFAPAKSLLLWLRYLIDAERATRGWPRVFVTYESLLHDWRATSDKISKALGIEWPRGKSHRVAAEIESFVSVRHRNQFFDTEELFTREDVAAWIKNAVRAAGIATEDREEVLSTTLDEIAGQMQVADLAFGPVVADALYQVDSLSREVTELRSEVAAQRAHQSQEIESLGGQLGTRSQQVAVLEQQVAALQRQITEHMARIDSLREELVESKAWSRVVLREIVKATGVDA